MNCKLVLLVMCCALAPCGPVLADHYEDGVEEDETVTRLVEEHGPGVCGHNGHELSLGDTLYLANAGVTLVCASAPGGPTLLHVMPNKSKTVHGEYVVTGDRQLSWYPLIIRREGANLRLHLKNGAPIPAAFNVGEAGTATLLPATVDQDSLVVPAARHMSLRLGAAQIDLTSSRPTN